MGRLSDICTVAGVNETAGSGVSLPCSLSDRGDLLCHIAAKTNNSATKNKKQGAHVSLLLKSESLRAAKGNKTAGSILYD